MDSGRYDTETGRSRMETASREETAAEETGETRSDTGPGSDTGGRSDTGLVCPTDTAPGPVCGDLDWAVHLHGSGKEALTEIDLATESWAALLREPLVVRGTTPAIANWLPELLAPDPANPAWTARRSRVWRCRPRSCGAPPTGSRLRAMAATSPR